MLLKGLPVDAPIDVYLSRHLAERKVIGVIATPILAMQRAPYRDGDVSHSSAAQSSSSAPADASAEEDSDQVSPDDIAPALPPLDVLATLQVQPGEGDDNAPKGPESPQ